MNTEENRSKRRELLGWIATFAAAIAIAAVFMLFFMPAFVSGPSMEPNYRDGDRFFITRDWCCGDYAYGDVVCIDIDGRIIIKRVIGLPGDTIEIKNGKVYRNGTELDESAYLASGTETTVDGGYLKTAVGDGEFFVLGDNRNVSLDSRSHGCVDKILGKTWFIYRKAWFN